MYGHLEWTKPSQRSLSRCTVMVLFSSREIESLKLKEKNVGLQFFTGLNEPTIIPLFELPDNTFKISNTPSLLLQVGMETIENCIDEKSKRSVGSISGKIGVTEVRRYCTYIRTFYMLYFLS